MSQWFTEKTFHGSYAVQYQVKKVLHEERSPYQKIQVLETIPVGKLLLLNEKTMVSELDEFVYHEVISHIPYSISREANKVLIIGGGDGGVVREFARHKDIKQIDLVEIDERVVEVSKKYFPECTQALTDPRVKVHHCDGIKFIEECSNTYDIIVIDSTDPEDFAEGLFTQSFYASVNKALTETGVMVAQTENPFLDEFDIKKIYDNLRSAFPIVDSYWAPITIYPGVYWTFGLASKKYAGKDLNPEREQSIREMEKSLKWYNWDWHQGAAFNLGNFHKRKLGLL